MGMYDIRVYKSWNARNLKAAWVNNYHVNFEGEITDETLEEKLTAIIDAEKAIHLQPVQFLHATISTTRDEPVYDPKSLKVFEIQGNGGRNIVAPDQALDLNIALKVKKQVAFGRSGTMFYRGALLNSDVIVNDRGEGQLKNEEGATNPVLWANFNNTIKGGVGTIELVMADKRFNAPDVGALEVRVVQSFAPSGVSIVKRDHRYYDVKSAAPVGV